MTTKPSFVVWAIAALFAVSAQAQQKNNSGASTLPKPRPVMESSEWKPHVGLMGGISSPDGAGNASGEVGVDVGYQYYIPFALGAEYMHSDVDNGTTRDSRDTVMAKASYNFGGENDFINKTYAALGLGVAFTDGDAAVAAAPILGFDYPLRNSDADRLSVGASTRYTFVGDSEVDTYSLTGVVKYWY